MLVLLTAIHARYLIGQARHLSHRHTISTESHTKTTSKEAGQATAEYALVLLGAAAVALLFTAWAVKSGKIAELFDKVFDLLLSRTE